MISPHTRLLHRPPAFHGKRILRVRGRRDIKWRSPKGLVKLDIPEKRLKDILDEGSLTQLLIKASKGDFRVEVLFQGVARPSFSERQCLRLGDRHFALLREVSLVCQGQVWVMARSVIPLNSLRGKVRNLRFQGTKPLGATLFKDPGLKRERFDLAKIELGDFISHGGRVSEQAWARRSVFYTKTCPILVAEAFLEACPRLKTD